MFYKICALHRKYERTAEHILRSPLSLGILAAMLLTACATTTINTVWKDESSRLAPHRIMVIGIVKLPRTKRILEDEFVKRIKAHGTDAVGSYNIIPDDIDIEDKTVLEKIKAQGADAVLITRLADKKTVYNCLSPNNYCPPSYYGTWHDYYWFGAQYTNSPDYVEETQYAVMETNLYDAVSDKLIWSASSSTQIFGSDREYIRSYVRTIVNNLVKQKYLGR